MAMAYESLVRDAFGFASRRELQRWGDPACLANTDVLNDEELSLAKAASIYAVAILNNEIIEKKFANDHSDIAEQIVDSLKLYYDDMIDTQTANELGILVEKYTENVLRKYFIYKNGFPQLI